MKNLVIVESPTKARTIGRFLGDDYQIIASMGHIMDLPKSKLSVDLENDFKPDYQQMPDKKKIIQELKSLGKDAENIILATDPDREGEAIAAHVKEVLDAKGKNFSRIVFHEITKEAVEEALKTPRSVDENLVDAQTARRVLDRLVGYKLSPILWSKVRRGLSAGRVQSIALRLIVEREREIEKFKQEKYYTIHALLGKDGKETEFELVEIDGKKIEVSENFVLYASEYKISKTVIQSQKDAEQVVGDLNKGTFLVSDVIKKQVKRSSGPAFTTSTLQQESSRRFGFSGKRTMSLAQKLYEEGYITYHRTDSVFMSMQAITSIRSFAEKKFGKNYVPESPKFYKTKSKVAQEAHEAIRPTKVEVDVEKVTADLGKDYAKIYEAIWNKAVASQMADAILEQTAILVDDKSKKYRLKANGSVLVFDGFLKIYPQGLSDNLLPDFITGDNLTSKKIEQREHDTSPPPRYNDASLIAILEEKGIGRPSTYATIISTIESRQYIERQEGRFHPTSVGTAVNDFLVSNFSTVDDIPFTALMEDELDEIANGTKKWVPVIKEFYEPFEKTLVNVKDSARVKIEVEKTQEICPLDGGHLIIRHGRFGKFMACENFPTCKFTKPLVQETNLICPKDGGKIVFKKTKKGRRFYGCSNYPKCDFAAWKLEDIKNPKINSSKEEVSKTEETKEENV
ncbi:MAG TPA: type I DNA topoisomerase [Candidatus Sulfotelmatobacter sp.]|nr:type I DNA topoisomerase [Candidatus Sulfotelmatobacter sp.]